MANPLTQSLAALFRSKADRTSLKKLAKEGIRTVQVLDLGRLEHLVGEAIDRALRQALDGRTSPERLAEGAQIEFLRLLGDPARLAAKGDALAREEAELASNLGQLAEVLTASKQQLASEAAKERRHTLDELRQELEAALSEAFTRGGQEAAAASPAAGATVRALQAPLQHALLDLLERAVVRGAPGATDAAEATRIELLERRIAKLSATLEETQTLLERVRSEKAAESQGVPSIHKAPQGIQGHEARAEERRALMRQIFQHNLELRRDLGEKPA